MTSIVSYNPAVQVLLHKVVDRKLVAGANAQASSTGVSDRFANLTRKTFDLTLWLSEHGGVRTSKAVSEAAGAFSITLIDRPYTGDGSFETLYGIIEPMDMVEIRMARQPHKFAHGRMPIVMRGFVSEVSRAETMTDDGRPVRQVTLGGQDWGKIWQIIQLKYWGSYTVGDAYLSGFNLFERYGIGFETGCTAASFLQQVVDRVINPFIAGFLPDSTDQPTGFTTEITAPSASVSVIGPQQQEGTIYGLLRSFLDVGAWNELYIEDRDDGPRGSVVIVYRPNPYKDLAQASPAQPAGAFIQPMSIPPAVVAITGADVISINVSRSDANVANWFWVTAPRFELIHGGTLRQYAMQGNLEDVFIGQTYPNSSSSLYGIRIMELDSQQGLDTTLTNGGQKEAQNQAEAQGYATWVEKRRNILRLQNKDNVVYESGSIEIKGNEAIKAGNILQLTRGTLTSEYYVTAVQHAFVPFSGFVTTLTVERGTGFAARVQRGSGQGTPFLSEMN